VPRSFRARARSLRWAVVGGGGGDRRRLAEVCGPLGTREPLVDAIGESFEISAKFHRGYVFAGPPT
jgi:hypothetical protein